MRPCDLTPPEERQKENEGTGQRREKGRKGQKRKEEKYGSVYSCYWVKTSKQTTKHLLLGNRFLIRKYTRPLLGNTFANKHVPVEMTGTTTEELSST
jgi:hypothetical protein